MLRLDWFEACCSTGGGGSSGGGGGTQTTNTVQKSDPWSGQQPYLTYGFEQAQNQFKSDQPQFYPGQTFAGPSAETQAALGMQGNRALMGNPLTGQSQGQLSNILGGGFLGPNNPYMNQVGQSVADQVIPQIEAAYSGAGRFDGGAGKTEAMARGLSAGIAPYAYGSYNQALGQLPGAIAMAPQLAAADYMDPMQLGLVGAAREGQGQQQITEDINRFNFGQNVEQLKLQQYLNNIQGNYGGQQIGTSTSEMSGGPRGNTTMGILGALLGGANVGMQAYSLFGSSDFRIKTNIRRIGMTDYGYPVYAFNYKSGGPMQLGVMAQDVEKVDPMAVIEINGIKYVNYARIR